jgi:DNA repair exonuclease SbcCD ATPase subunit
MNKIKSLLRNYKARTVSFFKAPYHKFYQSLWDSIHDQTVCLVSDKLENDQDFLDLEEDVNNMKDDKLNTDDFDYELCNNYTFTELSDKVDELEANSDGDPFTDIDDESHPVSKLIDDRNEQIHSMIIELKDRLDIAEQNLAVKTEQMEKVYTKLKELKNFDTVLSAIKDLEAKLPTNG